MATRAGDGSHNERTALAWRRTALSLLAASAVVARLTADRLGGFAVLVLLLVLPLSLWVLMESRGRYDHDAGVRRRARGRSGRSAAFLTVSVVVIALTELTALGVASL
jgi:uncharacterized membrane protein YidH (DUF202 family)